MKKTLILALSLATTTLALAQPIAPTHPDSSSMNYPSIVAAFSEPNLYYQLAEAFRLKLAKRVDFPEVARSAGAEGTVEVRIRVGLDGIGDQAIITRSAGPILDRAVLKAVYAVLPWRFTTTPGRQYSIDYPITFRWE